MQPTEILSPSQDSVPSAEKLIASWDVADRAATLLGSPIMLLEVNRWG